MEPTTSMTTCMASYFWLVAGACILKSIGFSPNAVDALFFVVVLITMFVIYSSVVRQRCGAMALGPVFSATLGPWVFMLGGVMLALKLLPGWKQPFSNTFGYMVVLIPGIKATKKLVNILAESQQNSIELIKKNPNLMLNEFASSTFDATVAKLQSDGLVGANADAISEFRKVIFIKDAVADFAWYMLVGSVAITTSFNIILNHNCQKTNLLDAPIVPPTESATKYIVDD